MKLTIAAVLIATALPSTAVAQETDDQTYCERIEGLARQIMESRQNGASMSAMMKIAAQQGDLADLFQGITLEAYERPVMRVEENQQFAIDQFANRWSLLCYRAMAEK